MICSLESICRKEVIDIETGERLGFIDDIRFDLESSDVKSLVIYGRQRLFGILGKEEDIMIPCSDVEVVGDDVLLVRRFAADVCNNQQNHTRYISKVCQNNIQENTCKKPRKMV